MPGGVYSALSGMQTRLEELDRVASDLANIGTPGYKTERNSTFASERTTFATALDSAVDVVSGDPQTDFQSGTITSTGRSLDVALQGNGFFVIQTSAGERYTRNGSFTRRADGVLTTAQGDPVLGEGGTNNLGQPIQLGQGEVSIESDGTVQSGSTPVGKLRLVQFAQDSDVARESGSRFRALPGATPTAAEDASILSGSLEQSNASVVDLMAKLTELSRSFETLQRGVSMLNNDLDARAITELAKR